MSKQESTNTFSEGLVMDLNPLTTPNNVLTNALNATLITYNGNEFVLQNDLGNGRVETAKLPTGFVPLGVKEYGGIIYVASYNPITNEGQLGSFPSPERNLSQNEISDKRTVVTKGQFTDSSGQIDKYYIRYDLMPDNMTLNPGDKFGIYIGGSPYNIISYKDEDRPRLVTFHPAILDDLGNISYIDDECKVEGILSRGIVFGEAPSIGGNVDDQEVFDSLLVYKGKKSGKLLLIVELETLEDFVVSRGIISYKDPTKSGDPIISTGSSDTGYSDDRKENEDTKNVGFAVKFYCSGWPKVDNDYIHFKGVKFIGNGEESEFEITSPDLQSMTFAFGGFKKGEQDNLLKYKIIPYTELGPNISLARTGIINFNLLGTGNIILNEWRYYVEGNKLRLNYGFDVNLLEGESVKEVTMEFYDVFYGLNYYEKGHIFNCKSTINGNFNGSYTEYFDMPYDLKYTDKYDEEESNLDYIYNNILGDNFKLKNNQLLRNNFYLVRITLKTVGLINKENKEQSTEKYFYRFLYTNGIFNKQYIEGEITNFSTILVDPYKVKLKTSLSESTDFSNNTDFKVEYYNSPTANGYTTGVQAVAPDDVTSLEEYKSSPLKANLFQDWGTSGTSKMTITADVKNIDSSKPLEDDNYYQFGEYAPGFFKLNDGALTIDNCKVVYDNSKFELQTYGGSASDEEIKYVDITKDTEGETPNKEVPYKNIKGELPEEVSSILGKTSYSSDDETVLKTFEELKDRQFFDISGSFNQQSEEGKDSVVTLPTISGRLIRRAASNREFENKTMECEEARPCFYKQMSPEEQNVMILGNSRTSNGDLSEQGMQIAYSGDWDGNDDNSFYFSNSENEKTGEGNGDTLLIHRSDLGADGHNHIPHEEVMRAFADNMNSVLSHSAIWPFTAKLDSNLKETGRYKAFTPGVYRTSGQINGSIFMSANTYDRCKIYRWGATSALWRTNISTEESPDYAFINLGGSNYKTFIKYMQKLLSNMYIVQPKVNRTLMVRGSERYAYSNQYSTKVNIGIKIGSKDKDGNINLDMISLNHSPVKLYPKDGKERYFDVKTVAEEIESLGSGDSKWKLEEDKWYKSIEDISGEPNVHQCSYMNIPYPFIRKEYENNDDTERKTAGDNPKPGVEYDTTLLFELTQENSSDLYLGFSLELGGSMDITNIVGSWDKLETSIQYIYIEDGDTFKMGKFVDYLNTPLNKLSIYYLTEDNKLISGSSDKLSDIKLKDIKYKKMLKNLFVLKEQNGFKIPVLNKSAITTQVYAFFVSTNNNGKSRLERIDWYLKAGDTQWPYYTDAYFGLETASMSGTGDFISSNTKVSG